MRLVVMTKASITRAPTLKIKTIEEMNRERERERERRKGEITLRDQEIKRLRNLSWIM
jgi:hypothetical protein